MSASGASDQIFHEDLLLKFSFSWEQYDQRLGCRLVNVCEYRKGSQQEQEWKEEVCCYKL